MSTVPRSRRFWRFWKRHRTLFWTLHSVWALLTGIGVLLLARERYGFVPWVVAFLALTWALTLYLGRRATREGAEEEPGDDPPGPAEEFTSYLTRGLYQETLFFLLPFYAYSTVVRSPNVLFMVLLGGLALLACLDLVFDRWLRTRPVFALVFFATVAYAATNLVLPMLVGLPPSVATVVAACIAVASAVPLAVHGSEHRPGERIRLVVAGAVILAVAIGLPGLVPPVPLRLEEAAFATGIERETLELSGVLARQADASDVEGVLIVRARVFAPSAVPTQVSLDWKRDGQIIRTSREIEITAHDIGFRIWDSWRPEEGSVPPGRYEVVLRTPGHRVFGIAHLLLEAP
ncbi:MAG TPA: DUF5924 family protein [Longimicrobiales bacterium]|nr:DUF5924 family protein [Longimicrobiales bacterium]